MTIYLYVKTHRVTGLKYLGMTTKNNPHEYQGSGVYWKRHIKVHGYDVDTSVLLATESKEEFVNTAKFFSDLWKVTESAEWANLMPETGVGGSLKGRKLKKFSTETRTKMSQNNVGFKGKSHTESTKLKVSNSLKGKTKNYSDLTCPHCGKIGKGPNMGRYHFTNCKHR